MLQVLEAIYLGKATPEAGGGGGVVDYSKTVQKSASIPTASASNSGHVYMYTGETNATYTHGYIYENQATSTYTADVTVSPSSVTATALGFPAMLQEYLADPSAVKSGEMSFDGSIWHIDGYDANNNKIVDNLKLYTEDLQDYGFTFTDTPQSGDTITYTCTITVVSTSYAWVRRDVQPASSSSGADTSLSNLTAAGKEVAGNMSMPGETRIDLSVVGPTVLITAIADGYMQFYFNTSLSSGQVHVLRSIDTQLDSNAVSLFNFTTCRTDSRGPRITVPIAKGEKALYETSDNSWVTAIRFVYAKGSEPTQGA